MEYAYTEASDGCKLAFQTSLPLNNPASSDPHYNTLVLLIHGFSGSSDYFQRNVAALSASSWVVAIDLRGHGESGRPRGGYHVARLAADLKEVISFLRSSVSGGAGAGPQTPLKITPVGCSIGAAILWTYIELFGDGDFASAVFVDQAPLQDRSGFDAWDATKAHRGCFDEASMLAAQRAWMDTPEDAYRGLVADCLGYRFAPLEGDGLSPARAADDEAFFTAVSRRCDPAWLARLLADHTRYDHREACELIRVPVLVMAGRRTGCFPLAGMRETVERVQKGRRDRGESADERAAKWMEFDSGHWLFWEEPERFNRELLGFVEESAKRV
jgi:pimeloyl-ACP methyl ester carboxylesterase